MKYQRRIQKVSYSTSYRVLQGIIWALNAKELIQLHLAYYT